MISYNGHCTVPWLADLLLAGGELGDVGVVALLHVLVSALQDWLLLKAGHRLLLLNTAETGLRVLLAAAEVNSALENYRSDRQADYLSYYLSLYLV